MFTADATTGATVALAAHIELSAGGHLEGVDVLLGYVIQKTFWVFATGFGPLAKLTTSATRWTGIIRAEASFAAFVGDFGELQ